MTNSVSVLLGFLIPSTTMSSDSHFEPPANSSRKCDRLKRLLKYTIPCLSNNALTSPLTDTTPVHGTSMDNGCPASLHPLFATENVESGARSTYRHYITGKNHHYSRVPCLERIFCRVPTSFYNKRAEIPASRHGQTRYFWAHE